MKNILNWIYDNCIKDNIKGIVMGTLALIVLVLISLDFIGVIKL